MPQNPADSASSRSTDECCQGHHDHGGKNKQITIFDIVKAGALIPLQTLVEAYGLEVLKQRDEKGHTPAHWAALGGHTNLLRYLIEIKGPVDEPSDNELGQRPIHWACVNGHVAAVDILCQAGVELDVMDNKGCTPLIVACQYGKTMLAGYLMGKGARLQIVDRDGDNALHWASFKGHADLMRLLIYSGFNPKQLDNFGQTPLHLATINGNLAAIKELVEKDNVSIDLKDKNGKTPLILAKGRKHHEIVGYLNGRLKAKTSLLPEFNFWSLVFGPPGQSKGPLIFFLVNVICWGYPMYLWKAIPLTWYDLQVFHIIFMLLNVVMWFCLYHANSVDPGFLPRNIPEYDLAIRQVAHFDEWKQGKNPLSRLCHTCRTIRPIRAKHCKICNRCVKLMDHHCPYIYNCVGYNNRISFSIFIVCFTIAFYLVLLFCHQVLTIGGWDWAVITGTCEAVFASVVGTVVSYYTIVNALGNLTTNERINRKRYNYLKDAQGKFFNPFDRGIKSNLKEFFYLKRHLTEDEVEFMNVKVV
ncbi:putative ZDHHC-type palmitoyltransferase 5 [Lineus longissimus]|uniref:putative ZDHHC-type palmitoyltransferase 5 n=1 Tax=Lineus longissimus TaxID=88925 RepID=UPI00315DB60E